MLGGGVQTPKFSPEPAPEFSGSSFRDHSKVMATLEEESLRKWSIDRCGMTAIRFGENLVQGVLGDHQVCLSELMPTSGRRKGRPAMSVSATSEERIRLAGWASRGERDPSLALRARIVLRCLEGATNTDISRELGVSNVTVGKWRRRFATQGPAGLRDAPRPGGPRTIDDAQVAEVVRLTLESSPPDAERWTTRSLAQRVGVSHATVGRIWREHRLTPRLEARD